MCVTCEPCCRPAPRALWLSRRSPPLLWSMCVCALTFCKTLWTISLGNRARSSQLWTLAARQCVAFFVPVVASPLRPRQLLAPPPGRNPLTLSRPARSRPKSHMSTQQGCERTTVTKLSDDFVKTVLENQNHKAAASHATKAAPRRRPQKTRATGSP